MSSESFSGNASQSLKIEFASASVHNSEVDLGEVSAAGVQFDRDAKLLAEDVGHLRRVRDVVLHLYIWEVGHSLTGHWTHESSSVHGILHHVRGVSLLRAGAGAFQGIECAASGRARH